MFDSLAYNQFHVWVEEIEKKSPIFPAETVSELFLMPMAKKVCSIRSPQMFQ